MKEQLIKFETAKLAKQKGFVGVKSQCNNWYHETGKLHYETNINGYKNLKGWNVWEPTQGVRWDAPTQSLLQKWLRDEYEIQVYVKPLDTPVWSTFINRWTECLVHDYIIYDTYEQALEAGLIEGLKLI